MDESQIKDLIAAKVEKLKSPVIEKMKEDGLKAMDEVLSKSSGPPIEGGLADLVKDI